MPRWPAHLQRAWRQASDRAARREHQPVDTTRGTDLMYVIEPEDKTLGRPKRGRLPDPDRPGLQGREPPPGWNGSDDDESIARKRF